jgi:hypothetical protein
MMHDMILRSGSGRWASENSRRVLELINKTGGFPSAYNAKPKKHPIKTTR